MTARTHSNILRTLSTAFIILLASACGADSDIHPDSKDGGSTQVSIQLSVTVGQNRDSRAGRPLESTDNMQAVSNVRVYLFRADAGADPADNTAYRYCHFTVEGSEPLPYYYIPAFEKDAVWESDTDETHAFLLDPYLEKGYSYKLLAVGRDDVSEGSDDSGLLRHSSSSGAAGWTATGESGEATTLDEAAMAINLRGVRLQTCELFSGCSEAITVDDAHNEFTTAIRMSRAVAGVLMYIENIPTHFTALASFTRPSIMPPYEDMPLITKGKEYKVSAVAIAPVTITRMVGLTSGTSCGGADINDNFRGYYSDFSFINSQERDGIFVNTNPGNEAHPNSLLAGNFVLPVDKPGPLKVIDGYGELDHTLYLVFYTFDNDMGDHTFATPFFWYPIENATNSQGSVVTESSYRLEANHIYCLGEKNSRTDAPVDLSALSAGSRSGSENDPLLILRGWE